MSIATSSGAASLSLPPVLPLILRHIGIPALYAILQLPFSSDKIASSAGTADGSRLDSITGRRNHLLQKFHPFLEHFPSPLWNALDCRVHFDVRDDADVLDDRPSPWMTFTPESGPNMMSKLTWTDI